MVNLVQFGFAGTVWAGALASNLQNQLAGAALSISAGTFLFIALSDLLPEVQFHHHDRIPLFLALLAGVLLMGAIAFLEDRVHESEHHAAPAALTVEHEFGPATE